MTEDMTPEEWLAYWVQRALKAEDELKAIAGQREKQGERRRIAIQFFYDMTREWGAPMQFLVSVDGGRTELIAAPIDPEVALATVAKANGYPDTPRGLRAARRWLARAKTELPYGDSASAAPIPVAWDE